MNVTLIAPRIVLGSVARPGSAAVTLKAPLAFGRFPADIDDIDEPVVVRGRAITGLGLDQPGVLMDVAATTVRSEAAAAGLTGEQVDIAVRLASGAWAADLDALLATAAAVAA